MTVASLGMSELLLRALATLSYEALTGWRTAGLVFLCSLPGCHAPTSEMAGAHGSRGAAPSAPPLAQPADPEPETARFWPLFCAKPEACVAEVWPAGLSRAGQALSVVALDHREDEAAEFGAEPASEAEDGPSRNHSCSEYWLVSETLSQPAQRALASRQWLAESCDNDKWETFDPVVDAEHRTFRYGGNSLFDSTRSFSTTTLGLDPVRLVETNKLVLGELSSDRTWNWDEFAGTVTLGIDYCLGKVPPGVEVPSDTDEPFLQVSTVAVPRLALPDEYLAGGWRTTELGTCAARVDGDQHGFALSGGSGGATDSMLRLLLSRENDLFVEITDDQLVADRSGFEDGDHLQLWFASPNRACVDPKAPSALSEWGVRLPDGRAFAGFGRPSGVLRTERVVDASGKIRLRIRLADKLHADSRFTVVYADRDQGTSVKRAIATSGLSVGSWWTLGEVTDIDSDPSTCVVSQGRLMASAHAGSASEASRAQR